MSDLDLNKPPVPPFTPPVAEAKTGPKYPADRIPSNWGIETVEGSDDEITARNSQTGSTFEGTIAEFNQYLRSV